MSPTVRRIGPYRFFFFRNEGFEPPHVHIQHERKLAKFWLRPVRLASSTRFAAHELSRLHQLVLENEEQFFEAWNDYFSPRDPSAGTGS
jgi:hypothetical protein